MSGQDPKRTSGRANRNLIQDVKNTARGRWHELFVKAGLPEDCLSGQAQPCPKCGGDDRFNARKDSNETGAVFCRHCFGDKSSQVRPGDGIATVAWWREITNGQAARWIAEQLGLISPDGRVRDEEPEDIIAAVARNKRMPVAAFREFGVKPTTKGRERYAVARVNVYNENGVVHSFFDIWPGGKGRFKRGSGNSGMFFPGRIPEVGETWVLVEGVKDAAALLELGYKVAGTPSNKMAAKYARLFSGVDIIIVPDLDLAGKSGAEYTAANLSGIAASVAVARLPGKVKDKHGDDVRDVLRKPDGVALIRQAIAAAEKWAPDPADVDADEKPEVFITLNEAAVADQVIHWLGRLGWESPWIKRRRHEGVRIFVRGGVLVHVVENEDISCSGRLSIRELPNCLVRERITEACSLVVEAEKNDEIDVNPTRPPAWLTDSIFRRGSYGGFVRPLTGIIQSPTIRDDGSILQGPGYDPQTGLIYHPEGEFPAIPNEPSKEDAKKAITELFEVLADFPMLNDSDRGAWVAMLLTMIGRSCVNGNVPLFAVTANIRGSGKSLLVDTATRIAYGHAAARKAFTRDDDEMRKVITAVALAGTPSVLLDNLDTQLGGAALDAAITSSTWSDRILGKSRMTGDLPLRTVWSATGNNMTFGSDVGRRVLPIRLQSNLETPEDRGDFKHPDLLKWIEAERHRLAVAALTILRAYYVAGCPSQANGAWGSFESWAEVIRGSIVWAGGPDPLLTRATALAGDETAGLIEKLITGIEIADPSSVGLTTSEIGRITSGLPGNVRSNESLDEAVYEICGDRFDPRRFGSKVQSLRGRVWQGRCIEGQSAGGGVKRWRIRYLDRGLGGSGGSNSAAVDSASGCAAEGEGSSDPEGMGLKSNRQIPADLFDDGQSEGPPSGSEIEI